MTRIERQFIGILIVLVIAAGSVRGGRLNDNRSLLIHVEQATQPWHDSQLESKLLRRLTRNQNGAIITSHQDPSMRLPSSSVLWNLDSLVSFGEATGSQFVLIVKIDRTDLETRKDFHLPLILHKYQSYGVIEGEMRLVDVSRQKLLLAEPITIEKKGPRIFQATMDDEINDPDLHITAPNKMEFFAELEDKLAEKLAQRVASVMRLR